MGSSSSARKVGIIGLGSMGMGSALAMVDAVFLELMGLLKPLLQVE